jgi:carbohydrate-selective porin OprB
MTIYPLRKSYFGKNDVNSTVYKYRVNDNISITPGVIWLTAPGQVKGGDDAVSGLEVSVIGTLRTTFTF